MASSRYSANDFEWGGAMAFGDPSQPGTDTGIHCVDNPFRISPHVPYETINKDDNQHYNVYTIGLICLLNINCKHLPFVNLLKP